MLPQIQNVKTIDLVFELKIRLKQQGAEQTKEKSLFCHNSFAYEDPRESFFASSL